MITVCKMEKTFLAFCLLMPWIAHTNGLGMDYEVELYSDGLYRVGNLLKKVAKNPKLPVSQLAHNEAMAIGNCATCNYDDVIEFSIIIENLLNNPNMSLYQILSKKESNRRGFTYLATLINHIYTMAITDVRLLETCKTAVFRILELGRDHKVSASQRKYFVHMLYNCFAEKIHEAQSDNLSEIVEHIAPYQQCFEELIEHLQNFTLSDQAAKEAINNISRNIKDILYPDITPAEQEDPNTDTNNFDQYN